MHKPIQIALAAALFAALAAGCSESRVARVPNVAGRPLDAAENELDARGLRYDTAGGGAFGIVVRSHWTVCRQRPRPGTKAATVTLYVARTCPPRRPLIAPDVVGLSLDEAESELGQAGLDVDAQSLDGDPILADSLWTVCSQDPGPGHRARTVELYAAHDCWNTD